MKPLSTEQRKLIQFLIILTDTERSKRNHMYQKISQSFQAEIEEGIIHMISIPGRYYLALRNIPSTLNDGPTRMYWRSKQSLDYAFTFSYANNLCEYLMFTEDDALPAPDYFNIVSKDILATNAKSINFNKKIPWGHEIPDIPSWLALMYTRMGYIGIVFPSHYLPMSLYSRTFYRHVPIDLLLRFNRDFRDFYLIQKKANIFNHIGKQSSSIGTH